MFLDKVLLRRMTRVLGSRESALKIMLKMTQGSKGAWPHSPITASICVRGSPQSQILEGIVALNFIKSMWPGAKISHQWKSALGRPLADAAHAGPVP